MCTWICPQSPTCRRFTAMPNDFRQSYFSESPWKKNPISKKLTSATLRKPLGKDTSSKFVCQYYVGVEIKGKE